VLASETLEKIAT